MIGFTEGGLRFLQYISAKLKKKISKIVVYYINDRKLSIVVIVVILILNLFL